MSQFDFHAVTPQPAKLSLEILDRMREVLVSEFGAGVLLRAGEADTELRCEVLERERDKAHGVIDDLRELREEDRRVMREAAERLIVCAARDIEM